MRGFIGSTLAAAVAAGAMSAGSAIGVGAAAPSASAVTAMTSAATTLAPRPAPAAYRAVLVAPERLPDGSAWTATTTATSLGISDDGVVAANAYDTAGFASVGSFVGDGARSRWLATSAPDTYGPARATAIGPTGRLVGFFPGPVTYTAAWDGRGRLSKVATTIQSSYYGVRPAAVNAAGAMAGCDTSVKVSRFLYWRAGRPGAWAPWKVNSNCQVGGISEAGLAVGTATGPHFRATRTYPIAVAFTADAVSELKVPTAETPATAVDISPNGTYILGRAGGTSDALGPAAFLSATRNPVYLRGAGSLDPRFVNDRGVVGGVVDGRGQLWHHGRLTDLTGSTARLPRGWVVTDVAGINRRGDIAATAVDTATRARYAVKLEAR